MSKSEKQSSALPDKKKKLMSYEAFQGQNSHNNPVINCYIAEDFKIVSPEFSVNTTLLPVFKQKVMKSGVAARFPLQGEVWPTLSVWDCMKWTHLVQESQKLESSQRVRRQALYSRWWERSLSLAIQWYYLRPSTATETKNVSCPHSCNTNCPDFSLILSHWQPLGLR